MVGTVIQINADGGYSNLTTGRQRCIIGKLISLPIMQLCHMHLIGTDNGNKKTIAGVRVVILQTLRLGSTGHTYKVILG